MRNACKKAGLHAFKKKKHQKLELNDPQRRLAFANWFLQLPQNFEEKLVKVRNNKITFKYSNKIKIVPSNLTFES
jgi:hypothetical protein